MSLTMKTVLNRVHSIPGFVYDHPRLVSDEGAANGVRMEVDVRPRRGSRGISSCCGARGPTYDTLGARRFAFIPVWGIATTLIYAMRRVRCPQHGVRVEQVPWATGKHPITVAYACFLASWARRLSWAEVGQVFGESWARIYRSVDWVVAWGLARRDLSGITAIGVDEVARRLGQVYVTLVYQIDAGCRRLLYVAEGRSKRSLVGFFRMLGPEGRARIRYVCSDMCDAYLKVIARWVKRGTHILDRYHIVQSLHKALDKIRAEEARRLVREGYEPLLKHTRWCFLKRRANLTSKERLKLRDLVQYDLRTVRAYLKVQAFEAFWEYTSPTWAGKFLDAWCRNVMRSRLEPLKQVARTLRGHRELLLNWFRTKKQYNGGIVEGLNNKVKVGFRRAYGYRSFDVLQVALYHQLGELPEPELNHRF